MSKFCRASRVAGNLGSVAAYNHAVTDTIMLRITGLRVILGEFPDPRKVG